MNQTFGAPFYSSYLDLEGGLSWAAFYIVCRVAREYELVAAIQNIQTDDSGHRAALIHAL